MKQITSPTIDKITNGLPEDPKTYWLNRDTVYQGVEDCVTTLNVGIKVININNTKLQTFVDEVKANEDDRIDNENERIEGEQFRVQQEVIRGTTFDKFMQDSSDAFDNLVETKTSVFNAFMSDNTESFNNFMDNSRTSVNKFISDNTTKVNKFIEDKSAEASERVQKAIDEAGTEGILDNSVTRVKLNDEVKNELDSLQNQIYNIIADNLVLTLTATSPIFIGVPSTITIKATSNIKAEEIALEGGNLSYKVVEDTTTLNATDNVTATSENGVTYTAEFTVNGISKTKTTKVTAVHKIYYGGANAYTELTNDSHALSRPQTSPAGNYTIEVAEGNRIYWIVPSKMSINKALIDNNPLGEIPLSVSTVTINDVEYKVYESVNTNQSGTYNITVS